MTGVQLGALIPDFPGLKSTQSAPERRLMLEMIDRNLCLYPRSPNPKFSFMIPCAKFPHSHTCKIRKPLAYLYAFGVIDADELYDFLYGKSAALETSHLCHHGKVGIAANQVRGSARVLVQGRSCMNPHHIVYESAALNRLRRACKNAWMRQRLGHVCNCGGGGARPRCNYVAYSEDKATGVRRCDDVLSSL